MLLYFHKKNKINKIPSQLSRISLVKVFLKQLFHRTVLRGVFKTQLKIYDRVFLAKIVNYFNVNYFRKKVPSWMFDWVLNTALQLDGCYLHGLSSLYVHIVVSNVSRM